MECAWPLRVDEYLVEVASVVRKHPRRVLVKRILRDVRVHPANKEHPNSAVDRAVGWQVRKRFSRGDVQVSAYGLDLVLPRSSGSLSNFFYFGERFEWDTINFIERFLRPGDVVLDVGANVGMFAYAAARRVGEDGRVICFEPLPWAAATIERNAERNDLGDRLVVHRLAASDELATVEFTADLDVSSHMVWTEATGLSRRSVTVDAGPLDDVLQTDRQISLMKLDVEGAEWRALRGFERHLERANPPVIIFEAHDHSLRKMGSSRQDVLDTFEQHGYEMWSYDVEASELVSEANQRTDLIAVHQGRLSEVRARLHDA
jgi:FkbM family methyltransferase